jgi:membrane-bound ClpP family serine protease
MVIHQITLRALSDEAKAQRKQRIAVSVVIALVFGLVGLANNPFESGGLSKLQVAIGSLATGYAVQAVCFIVFNVIALLGDESAKRKALSVESYSGEPEWSPLAGIHYFASLFMMFGLIGVVVSAFEQGFNVLGVLATAANIGGWVYIFKTTKP